MKRIPLCALLTLLLFFPCAQAADTVDESVRTVTDMPGLVAFWDFVKREPDGERRFLAHVPEGATNEYALDAKNYVKEYWDLGREAGYEDFPLMGRGPFGEAILIQKEEDETFRPLLQVPRERLHDTPLDIKGSGRALTVVAWAIRQSGGHALAGIWHEGTDLKKDETVGIQKVERGQRQYGLFAGNNISGTACAHLSENGGGSFLNLYAMHKSNSIDIAPAVPADSPAEVLDASWQCFAMTFDDKTDQLTAWLNGRSGDRWFDQPQKNASLSTAYNAWKQGHLRRQPGLQEGENPDFPEDQFYNPPEDKPVSVSVVSETDDKKVEVHEFGYTRVQITSRKNGEGAWEVVDRDLVGLRLNPWWYPHDIYAPDKSSGGPFAIGRVIHSARTVGFTGWIGGVAVFDRALSEAELKVLAALDDTL
ncbi:MAG: LamG domain-containing protein [Verrucomicrobiaceae bacterium]|nr:LamG domain-containing protein [Verrucomicrobiaceae bacterium]